MQKALFRVVNIGRKPYKEALSIQEAYRKRVLDSALTIGTSSDHGTVTDFANFLILVEHSPVYTVGLRQGGYSAQYEEKLRSLGAEFFRTSRGGLVTFHGPGQLVAYPIVYLKHFNKGLRWYVCQLEQTVVSAARSLGVKASTTTQTGVWVEDRKIASIGVHASRFVTTHGLALNCNVDLKWFEHISACGIEGVQMTSLSYELGRDVSVQEASSHLISSFGDCFQCTLVSVTDSYVDNQTVAD